MSTGIQPPQESSRHCVTQSGIATHTATVGSSTAINMERFAFATFYGLAAGTYNVYSAPTESGTYVIMSETLRDSANAPVEKDVQMIVTATRAATLPPGAAGAPWIKLVGGGGNSSGVTCVKKP